MKTRFLILSLLVSFACATFAQDTPGYKTSFVRNGAGDNWFVTLGAGAQTILGDHDDDADLMDRISVMPTLSIGKWFSPYWGVRVKGQGGSLHGYENDGNYRQRLKYYSIQMQAMWDLTNYWGKYSPAKVFSFIPYVGLGYSHRFELDRADARDVFVMGGAPGLHPNYQACVSTLTASGGIQFGFRLSSRINLDFDLGVVVAPDRFDGVENDANHDAIVSASAGLTFKLGKTTWDVVEPMDYNLVNDLNAKINALRAENAELSKRPVSCPTCPEVTAPTVVNEVNYVPNVVFFRLSSSKVDANQQISIYNTAQFIKESGEKIKVVGYADKGTGSDQVNMKLSEKRAKAVAHELINTYGIPSQNIVVEWKGSGEQPYKENSWNRVVIMKAD